MTSRVSAWRPAGETARNVFTLLAIIALAIAGVIGVFAAAPPSTVLAADAYQNPLQPTIDGGGIVTTCADPSVIYSDADDAWFMYCTKDPLNDADTTYHNISMYSSADLVNWTYEGDAFPADASGNYPSWAEPDAGIWAPEIDFFDGTWYLFYTVTDVKDADSPDSTADCDADGAIGVATSDSPLGPWVDSGDAVVDPRPNEPAPTCNFFWTFDPEVFSTPGVDPTFYIYFGSYYGGIHGRTLDLNPTDTESDATSDFQVTIPNRYEGPEVIFSGGYYYLFVSASNCCNGALTGYSVFAGRSTSPEGPYVDHNGVSLLDSRVGGTPVISMNGNRWVGPGHNTVFQDFDGQWWTIYHAIDVNDPFLTAGPNQRSPMLDPLDWDPATGFPTVRGGLWASDEPMPAPAAQPGDTTAYAPTFFTDVDLANYDLVEELSDDFDAALGDQWHWVRPPEDTSTYGVEDGVFRFDTQHADLYGDSNNASVLTEPAPDSDYIVEVRIGTDLGPDTCCHNYRQGGMVIYAGDQAIDATTNQDTDTTGDDAFIKLVWFSNWETRQTEFAKEVPNSDPFYGNTVVGPPHEWTFLRIVVTHVGDVALYRAYTSQDANNDGVPDSWYRGGVWVHDLGTRIGLVSMAAGAFLDLEDPAVTSSYFDYVHVYAVSPPASPSPTPATATPRASGGLPNTSTARGAGDDARLPMAAVAAMLGVGSLAWLVVARPRRRT
ncbi:MAG: family 43 glycosylhydrolase [Chloroflexota bacterium]|nr:family 43 glycosylhydrolase [Chloroflexota bacterium]